MTSSAELVEFLLNLYGLGNSTSHANPGRRSTMMELASATPLDGHDYSNFRTAVGKTHLRGTMEARHAIRHTTTTHTSPQLHNRKQAHNETIDTVSQRHAQHLSSSRTRHDVQKRYDCTCWSSGLRLGSRLGNAPKCYGVSLQSTRRNDVLQEPQAISHQSPEFYAASVCAGELLVSQNSSKNFTLQSFRSSRYGFRFGTSPSPEKGTREDSSTSKFAAQLHNNG